MPNVLAIGFDPYTIPGFDPEPVAAAIEEGSKLFAELGLAHDLCLVSFDELNGSAQAKIVDHLKQKPYDCVLIGGGIRKPEELLGVFQGVVNLVHWHAPQAAIAFNTNPADGPNWVLKALEQRRNR